MTSIDELTAEVARLTEELATTKTQCQAEVARLHAMLPGSDERLADMVKQRDDAWETGRAAQAESAKLRGELAAFKGRFDCAGCGKRVVVDEDGCCAQCGVDATVVPALAASRTRAAEPGRTRDAAMPATTATTGDILLQRHGESGETHARWREDDGGGEWLYFTLRWNGVEKPTDSLSSIALEVLRERLNSRAAKVAQPQGDAATPGERPIANLLRAQREAATPVALTFAGFSEANRERCEAPASAGGFARDLTDQTTAVRAMILGVAEEAGEVAGAVRSMLGISARKTKTSNDVAAEVADLVSYCDLLLQSLGHDLGTALALKFDVVSERTGWPKRLADAGRRTRNSGGEAEADGYPPDGVLLRAGKAVWDWARETNWCHFCEMLNNDGDHEHDCPLAAAPPATRPLGGCMLDRGECSTPDKCEREKRCALLAPPATREAALPKCPTCRGWRMKACPTCHGEAALPTKETTK